MTIIHYDVDKGLEFENLIVINVDEVLSLYTDKYNIDVLLSDTKPEFLGRFRRSDHNGSLISKNKLEENIIPVGYKLIIRPNGTVGVLSEEGAYFEFTNNVLVKCRFPGNEFGKFHSYTGMTMFNFNHLLDSYRVNHTLNVEEFESPWLIEDLYLIEEGRCPE